jgi:hypothetical protein
MLARFFVIIALAFVVGFGVSKVFEQGSNARRIAETGRQFDAALGRDPGLPASGRWYNSPVSIGLLAGGMVFVVGVVVVAGMKPKVP